MFAGHFAAALAAKTITPPSVSTIAWVGGLQWLLVAWALWIDRHRAPRTAARLSEAAA